MLTFLDKICSMVQRLNSYNLLTNKKGQKITCWKVEIELSINDNTKIPQIYTLPQFLSMSEKFVEFTDSTHIIY